jgi:hypothetical protein
LKGTIFWDVKPCSLIEVYQHFGGTYRHYLQDQRISQASKGQQASRLRSAACFLLVGCISYYCTLKIAASTFLWNICELCRKIHKSDSVYTRSKLTAGQYLEPDESSLYHFRYILKLSSHPCLYVASGPFPLEFPIIIVYSFLICPMLRSPHPFLCMSILLIISDEEYKLGNVRLLTFSNFQILFLTSEFSQFSYILILCFIFWRDQISHAYKITCKGMISVIASVYGFKQEK